MNKISSYKSFRFAVIGMCLALFFVIYAFNKTNNYITESIIFFLFMVWFLFFTLNIGDMEVKGETVFVNYIFRNKVFNTENLCIDIYGKPNRGVFYVKINNKIICLNYTRKNYYEFIKLIASCKESLISVKQFENLIKKTFQSLK